MIFIICGYKKRNAIIDQTWKKLCEKELKNSSQQKDED